MASDVTQRRPWTLMIYMAGDNGKVFDTKYGKLKLMDPMTAAGYNDLTEMSAIGSTDQAAVTCLFDTDQGVTYLVEVQRGGKGLAGSKCSRLPGVNTGDPNTLRPFIVERVRLFPAEHAAHQEHARVVEFIESKLDAWRRAETSGERPEH